MVKRLGSEGVAYRVRSPEKAFAGSKHKTAQQHVSDEEIGQLVAFFTWVGEIDNGDWPSLDTVGCKYSEEELEHSSSSWPARC